MPEIMNEIPKNAVEQTVDAVAAATPKNLNLGKKIGLAVAITGAIALVVYIGKTVAEKVNSDKDKPAATDAYDNVEIAKRDFLDNNDAEE